MTRKQEQGPRAGECRQLHLGEDGPHAVKRRKAGRNYNAGVTRLDSTDITGLLKAWGQGDQRGP